MTYDSLKHIDGTHISILDLSKFSNFRLKRIMHKIFMRDLLCRLNYRIFFGDMKWIYHVAQKHSLEGFYGNSQIIFFLESP